MDTYGDMVTLLLCFFVLLYSMSTLDQQKWQMLVQSFNPDAIEDATNAMGNNGPNADPSGGEGYLQSQEQVDLKMNELYQALQNYVAAQGAQNSISVTQGDGYVFISFNDAIFFDGDSYVLRDSGMDVLNEVGKVLAKARDSIDEVRVLGHTAQSSPDKENNVTADRFLASNRATVVLVYLQEQNVLDAAKLVSVGYGQWRPVAGNNSPEERAQNRRVELIVTGLDLSNSVGDSIAQYYSERQTEDPGVTVKPSSGGTTAEPKVSGEP